MNKLMTSLAGAALTAGLVAAAPASMTGPPVASENVRHVTNVPGSTGGHVAAEGDRLYVGAYGFGMTIFDVSDPESPTKIGEYKPGPQSTSDPGLRADAVPEPAFLDGRHIVTLNGTGRAPGTQQTEFLDVTDAANPVLLHRFTGSTDGEAHYGDIIDERRLWLPSGGRIDEGLRIYDVNPLLGEEPAAPVNIFRGNPHAMWRDSPVRERLNAPIGDEFTHAHDITVYTDHTILLQPWDWVDQDGDGTSEPTYGERDILLLAEGGSYLNNGGNTGSIYIIDVTDPTAPLVLNRWEKRPEDGHPIRYYHEAQLLDGDPSVMFVSDEDLHSGCEAGGVATVQLSEDLTEATWLADWFNGTGTPAPTCSAHNFSSKGHYVFMGSYNAGLQVIDMSDPANPTRAGQYIAPGANSWGALWHRGYIYVGDLGPRGLDVFEFYAPGVSDACQGRDIPLAEGEELVEHTVYMHGTSPSGNADAAEDTVDGAASRLFMDEQAPTESAAKVFAGKNYVVGPNPNFAASPLLGYWNLQLGGVLRVVCAEAVVYAGTNQGSLSLQLWADAAWASDSGRIAEGTGASTANQIAPYRVNFGPLAAQASSSLLVQATHEPPGSLLYYDSTARPSWFTYVTVEQTG
ncbi:MAG: hypothetical protein KY469_19960 [Actinobacteria bacterium]|nr:hypothetical protein [Actinomycetota bacterium]